MKKGILLMLLMICSIFSMAVGYANTNVNEQPSSEMVISVDDVLDIENQIAWKSAFDLVKVNILLCQVGEGGRSPTSNEVLKDLQAFIQTSPIILRSALVKGVLNVSKKFRKSQKLVCTAISQERGAGMQLLFYNQIRKSYV